MFCLLLFVCYVVFDGCCLLLVVCRAVVVFVVYVLLRDVNCLLCVVRGL